MVVLGDILKIIGIEDEIEYLLQHLHLLKCYLFGYDIYSGDALRGVVVWDG